MQENARVYAKISVDTDYKSAPAGRHTMKKTFSLVGILLLNITLIAQITVEELNHLLDTRPFMGFRVDYMSDLTLPDSVKQKFLIALSGNLTPRLQESLFELTPDQKEHFLELSKQRCEKDDSACIAETFQAIVDGSIERRRHFWMNEPISPDLILAAGSWNIREAISILEKAIKNERYNQRAVSMALARLGNDSLRQILLERYTLSYVLENTCLDTIDNNVSIQRSCLQNMWSVNEGIKTATYLQSKEMLLSILELIHIRGISFTEFGNERFYFPFVSFFVFDFFFWTYHLFKDLPNHDEIERICMDYRDSIRELFSKRRLSRREQQELDRLLSTEHRTKVKNQIRDWIIENVNFE